ncbi:hypothetical protein QOT17_000519 [Balamuthia mandrillaris]
MLQLKMAHKNEMSSPRIKRNINKGERGRNGVGSGCAGPMKLLGGMAFQRETHIEFYSHCDPPSHNSYHFPILFFQVGSVKTKVTFWEAMSRQEPGLPARHRPRAAASASAPPRVAGKPDPCPKAPVCRPLDVKALDVTSCRPFGFGRPEALDHEQLGRCHAHQQKKQQPTEPPSRGTGITEERCSRPEYPPPDGRLQTEGNLRLSGRKIRINQLLAMDARERAINSHKEDVHDITGFILSKYRKAWICLWSWRRLGLPRRGWARPS